MEKSFVFNSINGDRRYKAEDFREYFASFIGNGVFPNPSTQLQVLSNNDMTISVTGGKGFINGAIYYNTENLILKIDPADGILNRIDRIVLRFDNLERNITCKVKKGTFASNPTAQGLQRDADAYELSIAEIKINKGAVSILQSNITDTRLDSSVCGIVTQTVKTIDTKTLYNKLEAYIDERGKDVDGWLTSFKSERELSFNEWFNTIKGVLDGDVAGNLANRILEVENKLKNMKLESTAIDVVDTAGNFNEDSHGKKLLEDVLVQIDKKAKEAFQGADSGKKIIATAVGSPLSETDTFTDMGSKIDLITDKFKSYLKSAGVIIPDDIKMNVLVNRIKDIQVKKYTMEEKFMPKAFELRSVETLPYAFINGVYYEKGDYLTYFGGKVGKNNYETNKKKITINKNTLGSVQEVDLGYSQIYADTVFNNVYVKLKQEDNIAIYEYSNNLRLLDINTHIKEEIEIPSRDRPNGNVSVCKTDDNTSIYVLGGCYYPSSSQVEKYTEVRSFDPLTKTWTRKNDLNAAVANCVSIKVGNFIYSFHNGFKDVDKVKKLVRYDLLTQTSTILKQGVDLQMPNVDFAYAPFDYFVQNNIIYILTKDGLCIYNINKNILEFVKITSIGDKYNYMLSNYFIFNYKGVFYKCCGQENHVMSSYDPIFINTIQMVSILKE